MPISRKWLDKHPKLGNVIFLPFEHLAEKTTFEKVIN